MKQTNLLLSIIVVFMLSLSITSCALYTSYVPTDGGGNFPPTNPESIKMYQGDIDEEYTIIAIVTADAPGGGDAAAMTLKKKSAELGADAIIDVKLTKIGSFVSRTGVSGVAVKLKER